MLLRLVAQCMRRLHFKQHENEQMPDTVSFKNWYVSYVLSFYFFLAQRLRSLRNKEKKMTEYLTVLIKIESSGMSFQGTTFYCAMYEEFALQNSNKKMKPYLSQSIGKLIYQIRHLK